MLGSMISDEQLLKWQTSWIHIPVFIMGLTPTVQIPWGCIPELFCLNCYDGQLHNAQEFWSDVGLAVWVAQPKLQTWAI